MVYEARGENQKAAESYRKVIEFIRQHPDAHPPGFEDPFVTLVDRLDPPHGQTVIVAAPLALRQGADHPTLAAGDQTGLLPP